MVIMEMVKEFTSEEAFIVHPNKVDRWFDPLYSLLMSKPTLWLTCRRLLQGNRT
jgi:hypothetical protein